MARSVLKRLWQRKFGGPVTREERVSMNNKVDLVLAREVYLGIPATNEFRVHLAEIARRAGRELSEFNLNSLVDEALFAGAVLKTQNPDRLELKKQLQRIRNILVEIGSIDFDSTKFHILASIEIGSVRNGGLTLQKYLERGIPDRFQELFSEPMHDMAMNVAAGIDAVLPSVSPSGRAKNPMRQLASQRFAIAWAAHVGVRPTLTIGKQDGFVVGPFADYIRASLSQLPEQLASRLETEDFIRDATKRTRAIFDRERRRKPD